MLWYIKPWNLAYIPTPGPSIENFKICLSHYLKLDTSLADLLSYHQHTFGYNKKSLIYCAYKDIKIINISNPDLFKHFDSQNPFKTFSIVDSPYDKILLNYNSDRKHLPFCYRNCKDLQSFVKILTKSSNTTKHLKPSTSYIKGLTPSFYIKSNTPEKNWGDMFVQFNMSPPDMIFNDLNKDELFDLSLKQEIQKFYKEDFLIINQKTSF